MWLQAAACRENPYLLAIRWTADPSLFPTVRIDAEQLHNVAAGLVSELGELTLEVDASEGAPTGMWGS